MNDEGARSLYREELKVPATVEQGKVHEANQQRVKRIEALEKMVVEETDHSSLAHNRRTAHAAGFTYLATAEQKAKAAAYRKASGVRSRVGNSVPTSKSKVKNRQKAKAARKAKKR
jgi:hypothetical protein